MRAVDRAREVGVDPKRLRDGSGGRAGIRGVGRRNASTARSVQGGRRGPVVARSESLCLSSLAGLALRPRRIRQGHIVGRARRHNAVEAAPALLTFQGLGVHDLAEAG